MKKNKFIPFDLLKARRIQLGFSQKSMAEKIGISQQHWDRYEKGYPLPLDKILLISKVLNISKWELLPPEFQPNASVSFNKTLLSSIIISTEQLILEKNLHFSPEQKAKLILLLYERFSKNPSNDNMISNIQSVIKEFIPSKSA